MGIKASAEVLKNKDNETKTHKIQFLVVIEF